MAECTEDTGLEGQTVDGELNIFGFWTLGQIEQSDSSILGLKDKVGVILYFPC